jgi:hypothetical protein
MQAATARMLPACQRLYTGGRAGGEIDRRLHVQDHLVVVLERGPHFSDEREPIGAGPVERGVVCHDR